MTHEGLTARVSALEKEIEKIRAERDAFCADVKIYENLLDIAQGAITITRMEDGVLRFVNDTFCRRTGYRREEVLGRRSRDLNIFADPAERDRLFAVFMSEGKLEGVEVKYRAKDGSILESLISAAPIRFHDEDCIMLSSILINKQKMIQRELQEREEQYRLLVETANEGIVIIQDGIFRFTNAKFQQLLQYSEAEMIGLPLADVVYPDDRDLVVARQRQRQMGEKPPDVYELRLLDRTGRVVWMETRTVMINWQGGRATLSMLADMTERKRYEEELRQSEESYRNIMALAPDVISISRLEDGRYKEINSAFTELTGYTAAEAIGRTVMELDLYANPDDRKRIVDAIREHGQAEGLEVDFRNKQGTLIHGLVSARPIRFQGEPCIMVMVTNITFLKKARQALQQSEETYRLLVENAYEGTYITRNGALTFANARMTEITGYKTEELAEISFDALVHPEDRQEVILWLGVAEDGKASEPLAFRLINRDSDVRWVELNTVPITWEGNPAVLHFLRDMSLQKKMESQLIQAGKMEALGTLAGGIAHNFNNMLMGIQGHISLMLLDMNAGHPDREKLSRIETIIKDAAVLTKELLGLARGGKYEVKATDLNRLATESANLFGRTRKEIRVHLSLQPDLRTVEVDQSQVEQVLLNLFVNASQAMPDGGDLHIETGNITLDSYYVAPYGILPGRFVRLTITDTGIGMDGETMKRIFDPFFTTKEIGKGTGLGLASAYGIIRNHNGIINVYSEKGKGATFNIYLPASDKQVKEEKLFLGEIMTGLETILLVDDEKAILLVGKEILERLGYKVLTAAGGEEAVEIFRREGGRIAMIILDMIMPDLSGGDTFARLQGIDPDVRVLLSSGYSLNGQAKKIMERGCRGFIQKPYSLSDLSRKLREVLDA